MDPPPEGYDDTPQKLRDVIALFSNTTEVDINWKVADHITFRLDPTNSGDHLQHVKRLHLSLDPEFLSAQYWVEQANAAQMILDHLHLPSLESLGMQFTVSGGGEAYVEDFVKVRNAVCGIGSSKLRRVDVCANMPIRQETPPYIWASTGLTLASLSLVD
jgi:hypothetical protein